MRRLLLSLSLLPLIAPAATYDPNKAPTTLQGDAAKITWALTQALKSQGNTVDLRARPYTWGTPVSVAATEQRTVIVLSNPTWNWLTYTGTGTALTINADLKNCRFQDFSIFSPNGSCLKITVPASSSGNAFDHCRFQASTLVGEGMVYEGADGVDISANIWIKPEFVGKTGYRAVGSNHLDDLMLGATGYGCQVWLDYTAGGSNSHIIGGGVSQSQVGVKVNAGYQFSASLSSVELCSRAFVVGGVDGGGSGAPGAFELSVSDCRSTPVLLDAGTGGSVYLSASKSSGAVNLTNLNENVTAELFLSGAARRCAVTKQGKWAVTGQVLAQID